MPFFTFKGFTIGSTVALSAAQGGSIASETVAAWGENTLSASLEILKIEAVTVPAPAGVWFEAINLAGFDVPGGPGPGGVVDPSFDGITFVWTVTPDTEPANPTLSYGVPNLIQGWDDARLAYGKKVALFFPDPDTTYTVRCWAIDQSGNRGEASVIVVTQSANSLYPGTATICLDPSGTFAGAPGGAQQVASVSAMQSAIGGANSPCRVLIARGQDIANFAINDAYGGNLRFVGTFGSGNRPIVRTGSNTTMFDFYRTGAPQLTIDGLDCRGFWDAATETGKPIPTFRGAQSSILNMSIWDCRFDGFSGLNPTLNGTSAFVMAMGKTEVTNWQDAGIYVAPNPNSRLGFVGCDFAQHIDAINHSQTERNGMVNQQGSMRIAGHGSVYIATSSFMSRGGWSGGNDQPCLRLNSEGREGAEAIVERTTFEGGSVVVKMSGSNGGTVEKQGNYLFDKVLLMGGGGKTGRELISANFGGSTFRNVLGCMNNVPNVNSVAFNHCLELSPDQSDPGNLAAPIKIYNCSSLNLRTSGNDFGDSPQLSGASSFADMTVENNVVHAPGLMSPVSANSVTTNGASFFTPRHRGIKPNFDFEQGTLAGGVGNGASFALAYPTGTNQAYWQAIQGIDTLHMMSIGTTFYHQAFDGSFTVAFESSQVRITNTSGSAWPGGSTWKLRLDRKSQLPEMDTTYGNPATLALPIPVAGSGITQNNDVTGNGLWAYDDFLGNTRPAPAPSGTDHKGDPRPSTGRAEGVMQIPPT